VNPGKTSLLCGKRMAVKPFNPVCRADKTPEQKFYRWKNKFGDMDVGRINAGKSPFTSQL
jgi:hypothetical protein